MSAFILDAELEIGSVFEVAGTAIKIALKRNITELSRSYRGRVYDIGQIGSIIKIHMGRRILFATVKLLRLQTDEEAAALEVTESSTYDQERRVVEADLLGQGWYCQHSEKLTFLRGVTAFPLPMQSVYLMTDKEVGLLFASAENERQESGKSLLTIGTYTGSNQVNCRADIDKLLGHHCAILGSTGAGKSSAVAAIIHSILEHQLDTKEILRPSIILIDPHGEYAAAFKDKAKIYQAYDALEKGQEDVSTLQLPYWLMSSDEFRALVIGKTEFEATSQANIVYKALTHARMHAAGLVESATNAILDNTPQEPHIDQPTPKPKVDQNEIEIFDCDKPLPFSLVEFRAHITNRQAKRYSKGGWTDVTPSTFNEEFAPILDKLRVLTNDSRLKFIMQDIESNSPTLSTLLSQFLNVKNGEGKPLTIIDISGLPNEIAGPLIAAIARLIFQYKLHQTKEEREKDPVLFVCEEAHRYVPNHGTAQYEAAQSSIRRLAREGRKYGLGLMLVSQRPSDIEDTVISQCNSWLVLRLTNSKDQGYVRSMLPDSLAGASSILSSLQRQEALFVGEAAAIPALIKLRTLDSNQLPDSHDISFSKGWATGGITSGQLQEIADRMS